MSDQDKLICDEYVPASVYKLFLDQTNALASGKKKRSTSPNDSAEFSPLKNLDNRLEQIHSSEAMKHAVHYCSEDD